MSKKLAIIGASSGQVWICKKAKELGLETFCFAWAEGAVCKDLVDHFYPISIFERDQIVDKCRELGIDGVVSNASEKTAEVVSYVAEKLGLNGMNHQRLMEIKDKYHLRELCKDIDGLLMPRYYKYEGVDKGIYPCVIKPCVGAAKIGVSFVANEKEFATAIQYTGYPETKDIIVEEYIDGKELSVESISFHGRHQVLQITDKDTTGAPHFVEIGHHQPAQLTDEIRNTILKVTTLVLSAIGYTDGASHTELKYNKNGVYLIETNLRGGGCNISNRLTFMSTGIDYLRCMIDVALDCYTGPVKTGEQHYAGIYYLCKQTSRLLPIFTDAETKNQPWYVDSNIVSTDLNEATSNYNRNGFIIYKSDKKIIL